MSKKNILTQEIAEKFLKDDASVDLDQFTTIEESAAEVLSKCKGSLALNGLTTRSKDTVYPLAKAKKTASAKKIAKKNFDKAEVEVKLSREQLDAKLNRLGELVEQENLKLAADMIASFGDSWLYETLLAGSYVTADGELKPGKILKRFKSEAELIMALAMAYMPNGARVDLSIRTDALIHVKVTADNIDVVTEMIVPNFPNLKARVDSMISWKIKTLNALTAEFLVQQQQSLYFFEINTIRLEEAVILSKLENDLILDGVKQIDADVANALAQIKGRLSLAGLSSISESVAIELSRHMSELELGIEDLAEPIARALAAKRGNLRLTKLATISPEAAAALATHSGELTLGIPNQKSPWLFQFATHSVELNWGKPWKDFTLSVASARHLARHNGPIIIAGLKQIDSDAALALADLNHDLLREDIDHFPDGVAGIKLCTKMANRLWSIKLKRLQPDCAAVLAQCRKDVRLTLDEWNDDTLLALASCQGRLHINASQISDAVGLALSKRSTKSSLAISASVALSDGAAEALGNYPGLLFFCEGVEMSKKAATHLIKRNGMVVHRSKMKPAIRKIFEVAGTWSTWSDCDNEWARKS